MTHLFPIVAVGRVGGPIETKSRPFILTYATSDNQAITFQAIYHAGTLYVSHKGGHFIAGSTSFNKGAAIRSFERNVCGFTFGYFIRRYSDFHNAAEKQLAGLCSAGAEL